MKTLKTKIVNLKMLIHFKCTRDHDIIMCGVKN